MAQLDEILIEESDEPIDFVISERSVYELDVEK